MLLDLVKIRMTAGLVAVIMAGMAVVMPARGGTPALPDRYPSAYSWPADRGVVLRESFPSAVRPNSWLALGAMEFMSAGGQDVLRIVAQGIEPGRYYVGLYARTTHQLRHGLNAYATG